MLRLSHAIAALLVAGASSADAGCAAPEGGAADADVGPDAFTGCYEGGMPAWAREGGEVEIGTGTTEYEPIEPEQTLPLYEGIQPLALHFDVRPRIGGLHPGDPENNRSPENPHTQFSAYDESGELAASRACGLTIPYEGGGDPVDLGHARRLRIPDDTARALDGERVRIVVEVLDSASRYARSEVWVRADIQPVPF